MNTQLRLKQCSWCITEYSHFEFGLHFCSEAEGTVPSGSVEKVFGSWSEWQKKMMNPDEPQCDTC